MSKYIPIDSKHLQTHSTDDLKIKVNLNLIFQSNQKKGNSTDITRQNKNILLNTNYNYNYKEFKHNNVDLLKAFDNIIILFTEKDKKIIEYESKINQLEFKNDSLVKNLNKFELESQILRENNLILIKKIERLSKIVEDINSRKDSINKSKMEKLKPKVEFYQNKNNNIRSP